MRLDVALYTRGMTQSRSQAENFIKLGLILVNGKKVEKASTEVLSGDVLKLVGDQYVSRAALKLASIAGQFGLQFQDTHVLDVGSSTGGFTDYALQHGARAVTCVDTGTNQLHPSLRGNSKIALYEKTDIRDVYVRAKSARATTRKIVTIESPDIILIDVSFISLTQVLIHISQLMKKDTILLAMCKPQFEAGKHQVNKGVIKNSAIRRKILKDFEFWLVHNKFRILDKADSQVAGTKGNVERFYKLKIA